MATEEEKPLKGGRPYEIKSSFFDLIGSEQLEWMDRRKVASEMNCVRSPSLEWENTGKRVRPVITIPPKLISTPVRAWFMAPVPPASKVQISNTRERYRMGNKERQRERKREEKMPSSCLHYLFHPELEEKLIFFPIKSSFHCTFLERILFLLNSWLWRVWGPLSMKQMLLSTILHNMQQPSSLLLFG